MYNVAVPAHSALSSTSQHSMEEATVLCDRLGIFVDGQLVCLGSPQELTSRYADFYVRLGLPLRWLALSFRI